MAKHKTKRKGQSKRRRPSNFMTVAEAQLHMAEWAANLNADLVAAVERKLQRHRKGRRPLMIHGEQVVNRAALVAKVWGAVQAERERKLPGGATPKNTAIYAAVNRMFGHAPKSSWASQLCREHEQTLAKE